MGYASTLSSTIIIVIIVIIIIIIIIKGSRSATRHCRGTSGQNIECCCFGRRQTLTSPSGSVMRLRWTAHARFLSHMISCPIVTSKSVCYTTMPETDRSLKEVWFRFKRGSYLCICVTYASIRHCAFACKHSSTDRAIKYTKSKRTRNVKATCLWNRVLFISDCDFADYRARIAGVLHYVNANASVDPLASVTLSVLDGLFACVFIKVNNNNSHRAAGLVWRWTLMISQSKGSLVTPQNGIKPHTPFFVGSAISHSENSTRRNTTQFTKFSQRRGMVEGRGRRELRWGGWSTWGEWGKTALPAVK